eukprot:TRINITY_DN2670_c0_g1_i3.p1 TRINITY_DN2670_c0_g1~~TRINITY_DN2670_c0_g1_i3.p1  ORF type:complete len:492 (-),score=95.86 TRINITY_DN2670_c0_g1_i3:26-1501(-)
MNGNNKLEFSEVIKFYDDLEKSIHKLCTHRYGGIGSGSIFFWDPQTEIETKDVVSVWHAKEGNVPGVVLTVLNPESWQIYSNSESSRDSVVSENSTLENSYCIVSGHTIIASGGKNESAIEHAKSLGLTEASESGDLSRYHVENNVSDAIILVRNDPPSYSNYVYDSVDEAKESYALQNSIGHAIFRDCQLVTSGGPQASAVEKYGKDQGLTTQALYQLHVATVVSLGVTGFEVNHFSSVEEAEKAAQDTTNYILSSKGEIVRSTSDDSLLQDYVKRIGLIAPPVDPRTKKLHSFFSKIDTNNDGTIDYEEFVGFFMKELSPTAGSSVVHARLDELEKKFAEKAATFNDKRHPHLLKLIPGSELPELYGENRLYSCDGCHKRGRAWVYHCTEGCNWDLHPDCAGDYVAYDAEQLRLKKEELRTAFSTVRKLGQLMGLSDAEISEIEGEGYVPPPPPPACQIPTEQELKAVGEMAGAVVEGVAKGMNECSQQ